MRRYPGWTTGVVLVGLSVPLVLWAGTRPGFDPYGWLVWGHQTLNLSLSTNGAPSWKPLPFLFTVPYTLAGHYSLWLWMITAAAISLGGAVLAGRIAYRLTAVGPEQRYAAIGAAVFAGVGVLLTRDYAHFALSSQSDTVIVSLCLAAIDSHLSGRPRLAFALGVLASLGRPEAWPFVGLYALWLARALPLIRIPVARARPHTRLLVAGGLALIPLLWFGIPAFTAKSFFVAGDLALGSPRALHGSKTYGVIDRFLDLHESPLQLAALLSVGLALYRRDLVTLVIAAGGFAWVVIEIAFALHGWPAVPRYLFEPVAVMSVVAGVGVGRLLAGPPRTARLPAWSGVLVAVLLAGALVPAAISRQRDERKDLRHERSRAAQINNLHAAIVKVGGAARVRACGKPVTVVEFESVLAWYTGLNVGDTYLTSSRLSARTGPPVVYFESVGHGWKVRPLDPPRARQAQCRSMYATS